MNQPKTIGKLVVITFCLMVFTGFICVLDAGISDPTLGATFFVGIGLFPFAMAVYLAGVTKQ